LAQGLGDAATRLWRPPRLRRADNAGARQLWRRDAIVASDLHDDTSGKTGGGGGPYAWFGVHLPGAGGVEYDPANLPIAGANFMSVGVTREAAQSISITGAFVGNANEMFGMNVDASVSAAPIG
jgi:hypothetical protein